MELHKGIDERSAAVLGSKMLRNIDIGLIASAYGLNHEKYFNVLKSAIDADKWNDFTGEREKDYKTIKPYHDKLGKLLGLETDAPIVAQQINIQEIFPDTKYGDRPTPKPEDNI